jgi:hypothetical protein
MKLGEKNEEMRKEIRARKGVQENEYKKMS